MAKADELILALLLDAQALTFNYLAELDTTAESTSGKFKENAKMFKGMAVDLRAEFYERTDKTDPPPSLQPTSHRP